MMPDDLAGKVRELQSYDFESSEAQQRCEQLMDKLRDQLMQQNFDKEREILHRNLKEAYHNYSLDVSKQERITREFVQNANEKFKKLNYMLNLSLATCDALIDARKLGDDEKFKQIEKNVKSIHEQEDELHCDNLTEPSW
jgi:CHASE3 domain sensor protein